MITLLLLATLTAKEPATLTANWNQLPAALEARVLTIEQKASGVYVKGRYAGQDENGITIDQGRKRGSLTISRRDIKSMRVSRKKKGVAGRAVGTAVAGAAAAGIIGFTLTYLNNEGGVNSDRGAAIAATAIAIGGGVTALGYFVGDAFDGRYIPVHIPDL